MGVGGRHGRWVETGGKKFVEHIGLIRVRCSSGGFITKSGRNCRTARFELSDSCPELLGVISGAGKVLKEHVTADSTEGVNEAQRRLMTPVYTYS